MHVPRHLLPQLEGLGWEEQFLISVIVEWSSVLFRRDKQRGLAKQWFWCSVSTVQCNFDLWFSLDYLVYPLPNRIDLSASTGTVRWKFSPVIMLANSASMSNWVAWLNSVIHESALGVMNPKLVLSIILLLYCPHLFQISFYWGQGSNRNPKKSCRVPGNTARARNAQDRVRELLCNVTTQSIKVGLPACSASFRLIALLLSPETQANRSNWLS